MDEKLPQAKRPRGRPKGASTPSCRERARSLAQAKVKPLDVMLKIMAERWEESERETDPDLKRKLQDSAAQHAEKVAPFLHAKLQATTIKGDQDAPLSFTAILPTSDVLKAMIRGKE